MITSSGAPRSARDATCARAATALCGRTTVRGTPKTFGQNTNPELHLSSNRKKIGLAHYQTCNELITKSTINAKVRQKRFQCLTSRLTGPLITEASYVGGVRAWHTLYSLVNSHRGKLSYGSKGICARTGADLAKKDPI